ncbi:MULTISPECIES: benzoate/H(+) symporter BenE family transporter [Pseudomonas]|uniref:Benzoate/H(+) symporter BenE family transporter n=1 Tax=Pseudomonas sessilinigenes TaxID=658629 RepID=A0ABX8MQI4_9PSED|nr:MULTISPECIES: benzoate/H(+) symporter BenE family transporter [Pseudomonas]AZC22442.1 Benzoate transport protein [Pseudomonas sessilinigenes]QIH06046.1 benzoate/H(+) symporter BenE family transporter [Pseudomonas sp. BIOMIG1BAC]QXH41511.1 benzoate/H(+) symporter BenE family transporter [Pseudomonas sessilinigenes]UMZ12828.1 benzoate/H(+) symporter BenE family transporter [Pseudomonas sp. MPFS]
MNRTTEGLRPADFFSPTVAALISVLVNYGGTFVLVLQAAELARLSPAQTASWVWAVSVGVGVSGLWLSLRYRAPVITAWSTPGAAFLATVLPVTPYAEVIGAYLVSALGFIILGACGAFERLVQLIPKGIAAGLLAGILLPFGINAFGGASVDPLLVTVLLGSYALLRRFTSRFAVVGILGIGLALLIVQQRIDGAGVQLSLATPLFTPPQFSLPALLGVALPLFVITLTGQYMPGMLVLRNDGFKTSANPLLTVTGLGSLIMAPFGAHAFNVAAITAAICTGPDAHPDPGKRYLAGIACGLLYILVGTFGVTLASLFMVLPKAFIGTLAGLALLGAIGGSLANAMADAKTRETALITFLATVANVSLLGVGGAFWGLLAGLAAHWLMHGRPGARDTASAQP